MTDTLPQRIEAASGPDRELDCRIWWHMTRGEGFDTAAAVVPDFNQWQAPFYTASIDAALPLVPEGWRFFTADASVVGQCSIMLEGPKTKWAVDIDGYDCAGDDWYTQGQAATPALALCAAALRAKDHPND